MSLIRAVYSNLAATTVTFTKEAGGSVTVAAKDLHQLPNAVQAADAPTRLLLPYAFASSAAEHPGLELHRIDAACIPDNEPSRQLLRRCGFREVGLAPRYLRINGDWRDHICHQLLAEDFAGTQSGPDGHQA